MPTIEVFNEDCMEVMSRYPDKYFDLAVVDPPYGGGCSQSVDVERESNSSAVTLTGTASQEGVSEVGLHATISAERTGGEWAKKYQQGSIPSNIKHWDMRDI